jgi:curved DNA-binding protein CbpA
MPSLISRILLGLLVFLTACVQSLNRCYYEVLEVPKDASASDIKKAYRRLALRWHPDKSKEPEAQERFREVAQAYEVLGDQERRRQYDSNSMDTEFVFNNFHFHDAGDVFKAFFGDDDPFTMFDKAFEDLERDLQNMFEAPEAEASGGFFSMFSGFFSSFSGSSKSKRTEIKLTAKEGFRETPTPKSVADATGQPSKAKLKASEVRSTDVNLVNETNTALKPSGNQSSTKSSKPIIIQSEQDQLSGEVCSHSVPGTCNASNAHKGVPSKADCTTSPFQNDSEPVDSMVKHTLGSACCNPSPTQNPTTRLGCCQRCFESSDCEVYVWQPSGGSCWLLRWQADINSHRAARDRVMGDKPGLVKPVSSSG